MDKQNVVVIGDSDEDSDMEKKVNKYFTAWKVSKYRVFSGPYFPAFRLNTERFSVSLRIQSECGKTQTRQNSVFGHFSRSAYLGKVELCIRYLSGFAVFFSFFLGKIFEFYLKANILLNICFWAWFLKSRDTVKTSILVRIPCMK